MPRVSRPRSSALGAKCARLRPLTAMRFDCVLLDFLRRNLHPCGRRGRPVRRGLSRRSGRAPGPRGWRRMERVRGHRARATHRVRLAVSGQAGRARQRRPLHPFDHRRAHADGSVRRLSRSGRARAGPRDSTSRATSGRPRSFGPAPSGCSRCCWLPACPCTWSPIRAPMRSRARWSSCSPARCACRSCAATPRRPSSSRPVRLTSARSRGSPSVRASRGSRDLYLRRGRYYEVLRDIWQETGTRPERTLLVGDIYELDCRCHALPPGCRINLIASEVTPDYERALWPPKRRAASPRVSTRCSSAWGSECPDHRGARGRGGRRSFWGGPPAAAAGQPALLQSRRRPRAGACRRRGARRGRPLRLRGREFRRRAVLR